MTRACPSPHTSLQRAHGVPARPLNRVPYIPASSIHTLGGSAPTSSLLPRPSPRPWPWPGGAIVGDVIGGIAVLLLAALLFLLLYRRRHSSREGPFDVRRPHLGSDPCFFESERERLEDRRPKRLSTSFATHPHSHPSQPCLHTTKIAPSCAVGQPRTPGPSADSETSHNPQGTEQPRTSMFSSTASAGGSKIDSEILGRV
ncbi:hypothetical protein C8Q73DRAFT_365526 [Cubamyces lactineus]|nr:hypothetical protein C8Q73DRAFT_365526 [Cubamyces lactineus]